MRERSLSMSKFIDLTGQKFNRLMVVEKTDKRSKGGSVIWKCKCDCGNPDYVYVASNNLRSGHTKSCGCLQKEQIQAVGFKNSKANNLIGHKFGHLTVLSVSEHRSLRAIKYKCQCDCSKKTIVYATSTELLRELKTSCGCTKVYSKGEERIASILTKLGISFSQEYQFVDCINPNTNRKLRFDFYLPDYNCCIEYDGLQHYKSGSNTGWNNLTNFKDCQFRDSLKDQYCQKQGIVLIRIPYWDYNKLNTEYVISLIHK